MKKLLTKILLYSLTLIHLPWTIIRVIVACTLIVDDWCTKTINNWLESVKREAMEEEIEKDCETLSAVIDEVFKRNKQKQS